MLFNSIFFFITLCLFFGFYFSCRRKRSNIAKIGTLIYSYIFYGMWNPAFLILLLVTTIVDYCTAIGINKYPSKRKFYLILTLVVDFSILGFFKYYNFFVLSAKTLADWLNLPWSPATINIMLPVGISFYMFHSLSYTIDIYRKEIEIEKSFLNFAVFVSFFPLLVAGPIIRASYFLPQLNREPSITQINLKRGLVLILAGLFLKSVIADNVAPEVVELFNSWKSNTITHNWLAALLFGVQIYADFNGYSLVAIGIAEIMGFKVLRNFKAPYSAAGFSDFWRRWHISLSSWFRDYLYIPLGGSRGGNLATHKNLMITMGLCGLWHGASYMFVLWGLMHGLFLCAERVFREAITFEINSPVIKRISTGFLVLFTYLMVSMTWVPFRASTFDQCIGMMRGMFIGRFACEVSHLKYFAVVLLILISHNISEKYNYLDLIEQNSMVLSGVATIILLLLFLFAGKRVDFIYFNF
jgi:alginate O-acetyltransferase complex protein AlgI